MDCAAGGVGFISPARDGRRRVTRSVRAATWLDSEVTEVRRVPISPVTWPNAEDSSVFSLPNWSEWARTTVSRAGWLGDPPAPVGCLGHPGSMGERRENNFLSG